MNRDFFISRAGADNGIALTIAAIVRRAGFSTLLQDEDFGHADFMAKMAQGYSSGARMIALLSSSYQQSEYCKAEYENTLIGDPRNLDERLILLRIEAVVAIEHLRGKAYTDLVPVLSNATELERVVRIAIGADPRTAHFLNFVPDEVIVHPSVSAVAGFTGREDELASIDNALFGAVDVAISPSALTDAKFVSAAVQGLGGVGKSVLAKQYAWIHRDRFVGIWWLRGETTETLDEDLLALGTRIILDFDTASDSERAVQSVLEELARQGSTGAMKPWLLIYDNVEQPQHILDRLPRQGAHVLITSRWTDWFPNATALTIDIFPPKTAFDYLLQHAHNENQDSAAELSHELGYLPLALEHARAYCWQSHCTFKNYQSRVANLIKNAPANSSYPATVFATIDLAIAQAVEQCPKVKLVMSVLSFLAPDGVPLYILDELTNTDDQRDAVLGALNSVSLLTHTTLYDGTPAVSQHRLVTVVVRSQLRNDHEKYQKQTLKALLAFWIGRDHKKNSTLPRIRSNLIRHASFFLNGAITRPQLEKDVVLLSNFVAEHLAGCGQWEKTIPLLRRSLKIRKRVLGVVHPDTLVSFNKLEYNLNVIGWHDEVVLLRMERLEICRRVYGEEHINTAVSYMNLATSHQNVSMNGGDSIHIEKFVQFQNKGLEIEKRWLKNKNKAT